MKGAKGNYKGDGQKDRAQIRKLEERMRSFIIMILLCLQSMPALFSQWNHRVYSTAIGTVEERETEGEMGG